MRLSTAVRDFTIEISVSRLDPHDMRSTRNLVQSVIRATLAIKPDTALFDINKQTGTMSKQTKTFDNEVSRITGLISGHLADPVKALVLSLIGCVQNCDTTLRMVAQGEAPSSDEDPNALSDSLRSLETSLNSFQAADRTLIADPNIPPTASAYPEIVSIFLFVHPLRRAADEVILLSRKIIEIQERNRKWAIQLPSYPLHKQFNRTNAQVRHDRGGLTAGFYFRTKQQLEKTMGELQSRVYVPSNRHDALGGIAASHLVLGEYEQEKRAASDHDPEKKKVRYKIWEVLHRLQGFESRFAIKAVLVTTLLSVPAWLQQSRGWWNEYQVWWTVVTVWLMTHPRVTGTFQDLAARLFCMTLGVVWGALAYAARSGDPYVMAVFAAIFMIPMLHRYTQSAHPRSGVIGCISFTVVSLSLYTDHGKPSVVTIAWTRGLAFGVAIVASLLVNWIMWPFVSRHELRKSLAAMMLHLAVLYRGVVSKYIYYVEGQEPSLEDIKRSEMLEVRLREGFVRIRQLMELTRHEIVSTTLEMLGL